MPFEFDIHLIMLTGFIVSFALLNLIAYMISSFYRRKFDQPAPRAGFVIAIVLILIFNAGFFAGKTANSYLSVLKVLLIFGASVSSAVTSASLYYTMKKAKK